MKKEQIQELRFKLGLTQKAFAEKLEVSLPTVIAWENEKSSPSPRFLFRLKQLEKEV